MATKAKKRSGFENSNREGRALDGVVKGWHPETAIHSKQIEMVPLTLERWLPVVGYEGAYEVSDWGRVRSLDRVVINSRGRRCPFPGVLLKLTNNRDGYATVGLNRGGVAKRWLVHRLVLEAHVGPCPEGMECCHENGIKTDNRRENLKWDTKKENEKDKLRHGTDPAGERNGNASLTTADAIEIREQRADGVPSLDLAEHFGISRVQVNEIAAHRAWVHVSGGPITQGRVVVRGVRNGASKLNPDKAREIRRRYANDELQKDIAADLGISHRTVSDIVRRVTWAHVA